MMIQIAVIVELTIYSSESFHQTDLGIKVSHRTRKSGVGLAIGYGLIQPPQR